MKRRALCGNAMLNVINIQMELFCLPDSGKCVDKNSSAFAECLFEKGRAFS